MGCEMPIVIEQSEFYKLQEKLRQYKEKKQEREKKNLRGFVELPKSIENEYKELDKREIGILNRELNNFINDNISFYLMNGKKAILDTSFNGMYSVLFDNVELEGIKDKFFLYHTKSLTKMLLGIVNCNEKDYKDYNMDIVINSEDKKQEIKKVCEKLFLNILTRKYNILREQDKLDFKLPSKEISRTRNNSTNSAGSKDTKETEGGGSKTVSSIEDSDGETKNSRIQEEYTQKDIFDSRKLKDKIQQVNIALENKAKQK